MSEMSEKDSSDGHKMNLSDSESTPRIGRLCYVDDSKTSAFVVRRVLEPLGYQVDHFATAEPAFVALIQKDYDLLLTDLKVSSTGMDGDELIRTVRESGHPKISAMPIIVITGATDPEVLLKVYDAGANQIMNKPVDGSVLDGHIRRLMFDGRRAARSSEASGVAPNQADTTVVPIASAKRASTNQGTKPQAPKSSVTVNKAQDIPVLRVVDSAPEIPKVTAPVQPSTAAPVSWDETAREDDKQAVPTPSSDTTSPPRKETEAPASSHIDQDMDQDIDDDFLDDEVVIIDPEEAAKNRRHARATDGQTAGGNILYELEKYSLVYDRKDGLQRLKEFVANLRSLLEDIGARGLLLRAGVPGVLLIIGIIALLGFTDKGVPVEMAVVELGEISQSITAPGRVVSKHTLNVSPSQSGRLIKTLVKEGDKVEVGQLLAKLDDREVVSRLNRAKANLSDAREGIALAERTLERMQKAFSKGAIAARFVEDAEAELRTARTRAGVAVEEVHSVTLELDNHNIAAPFAGTVTQRSAEIGQWVTPADTLFVLVDESQREIELWIDAADSAAVVEGQVVAVSSDAFPGRQWQENVIRMGTATDNQRNSNSVKVYVSLGDNAPGLRFGQQIDADIRTAWNPNALKVPFGALINRDGQNQVAVFEQGELRLRPVTVGIEDFTSAEITQGLREGEWIILVNGQDFQDGDKVYPVTSGE